MKWKTAVESINTYWNDVDVKLNDMPKLVIKIIRDEIQL